MNLNYTFTIIKYETVTLAALQTASNHWRKVHREVLARAISAASAFLICHPFGEKSYKFTIAEDRTVST